MIQSSKGVLSLKVIMTIILTAVIVLTIVFWQKGYELAPNDSNADLKTETGNTK